MIACQQRRAGLSTAAHLCSDLLLRGLPFLIFPVQISLFLLLKNFYIFLFFVFTFLNLMTLYYLEGFFFSVGHPRHISPKKKQIHRESDGLNRSGDSSVAKAFKAHSEQGIIFNLFSAFIGLQFYRTTK